MDTYRVRITFETYVTAIDKEDAYKKAVKQIIETNDNEIVDHDITASED